MHEYLILLISVIIMSCSINPNTEDCESITPEMNAYNFSVGALEVSNISDSRLDVQLVDGNNLVFDYIHSDEDCLTIIDDESGERIQFEIDSALNAISLKDEELSDVNFIYYRTGAWANVSFILDEGTLELEKISETEWQVAFNADVDRFNIGEVSINDIFTLK